MIYSRFRKITYKLYHVTYRSYTDGRTGDDLSQNSTFQGSDDVRKCSIHSLACEIHDLYYFIKEKEGFDPL